MTTTTHPKRVRPAPSVRPAAYPNLIRTERAFTRDELKALFRAHGLTFAGWARAHGYPPSRVIRLVNGFDKGYWGTAHEVAIKLGLKLTVDAAVS